MQTLTRQAQTLNEQLVFIQNDKTTTTSLKIAAAFGKSHKNILRDIEGLECSVNFHRLNFEPIFYKDKYGRKQKAYNITKDGFTMLAMGFTGAKAMRFKEAYIKAFNQMQEVVSKRMYGEVASLTEVRKKVTHKKFKSASKETILYRAVEALKYLGQHPCISQHQRKKYAHLIAIDNAGVWIDEDFLIMRIRNKTAITQRKIAEAAAPLLPSNFGQIALKF